MAPLIVNRQLVRIVNFEICFSRDTPGPVEQTAMAVISERWGSGLIGEDGVVEGQSGGAAGSSETKRTRR